MNTKITSAVLALALAAMACAIVSPASPVKKSPTVEAPVHLVNFTSTPTTEPLPTGTNTPHPSTETRPPTKTSTPRKSTAKVTGARSVYIRSGPCYQPEIMRASPGMEFLITGQYTSPRGEKWWRIQLPPGNNKSTEGWIWDGYVEVDHATLAPAVASECAAFPTITPPPTETPRPTATQMIAPTDFAPTEVLPACQTRMWRTGGWVHKIWPPLINGDREFDGHGPNVEVKTYLYGSKDIVWGIIRFLAEETEPDTSTAFYLTGELPLARVPNGWRIRTIYLSRTEPVTNHYYSEYIYTDTDHDYEIYDPQDGGPVSRFVVMGDTRGNDIGQTWDDTHLIVYFNYFDVELIQDGNCR